MLAVDQKRRRVCAARPAVAIKFDEMPYSTFYTTIAEIGPEMTDTSRQMSSKGGGELLSKADAAGNERPINTSFQARAPIDDADQKLMQGLRGTAKIRPPGSRSPSARGATWCARSTSSCKPRGCRAPFTSRALPH